MSENQPNPYENRDHDSSGNWGKDDVLAVAGLLGQVTGSLADIDRKNVGGASPFIQAKKIDPKQVLRNMASGTSQTEHIPIPNQTTTNQPLTESLPIEPINIPPPQDTSDLERRVRDLERIVESYKKITKFKRGISYNVTTSKIAGEFKDPADILDVISTELTKQTKSITIKLNDKNKN